MKRLDQEFNKITYEHASSFTNGNTERKKKTYVEDKFSLALLTTPWIQRSLRGRLEVATFQSTGKESIPKRGRCDTHEPNEFDGLLF